MSVRITFSSSRYDTFFKTLSCSCMSIITALQGQIWGFQLLRTLRWPILIHRFIKSYPSWKFLQRQFFPGLFWRFSVLHCIPSWLWLRRFKPRSLIQVLLFSERHKFEAMACLDPSHGGMLWSVGSYIMSFSSQSSCACTTLASIHASVYDGSIKIKNIYLFYCCCTVTQQYQQPAHSTSIEVRTQSIP